MIKKATASIAIIFLNLYFSEVGMSWVRISDSRCTTASKLPKQPTLSRTFCRSTVSFPDGSALYSALQGVVLRWSMIQNMQFNITTCSNFTTNNSDNQSGVWFIAPENMPSGSDESLAVHVPVYNFSTCTYTANDIMFNTAYIWNPYEDMNHQPFNNSTYIPFHGVAIHEFGHALGLNHDNRGMNIMGHGQTYQSFVNRISDYQPGTNSALGAQIIYGKNSINPRPDVAVLLHRFDKGKTGSNVYSDHKEGIVLDPSSNIEVGFASNSDIPGPGKRYNLKRGQTYRFQVTFENRGYVSPTSLLIYGWLSADINIGPPDRQVGSWSATSSTNPAFFSTSLADNAVRNEWPWETTLDVTIPPSITTGNANLGFTVSCTVAGATGCNDGNSYNNSTYYAINIIP